MTPPVWLIAEREFRTYAATASFWVALAIGPLILAGMMLMTHGGAAHPAPATLTLSTEADGSLTARFSDNFPLSGEGRAAVLRDMAKEVRLNPALRTAAPAKPTIDPRAVSRFVLVLMLWMTLTGSLGMLLNAVVRERANRALESLLAAASPLDIVGGKLIGVGGVSLLVLASWLGSTFLMGGLMPASGGLISGLLRSAADPLLLAHAALVYVLGFAFYGFTTVAIGGLARDNADAQNLARPMFAVLLAVFFAAFAAAGGGQLDWLVYVPPFTPFMLLMHPHSLLVEMIALGQLAAATALAAWMSVSALTLSARPVWLAVLAPKRRAVG